MDKEKIRTKGREAAEFSKLGVELIKAGKYKEGHSYMRSHLRAHIRNLNR